MPFAWQCRRCKGPPLPEMWVGPCPNCHGFYRAIKVSVSSKDVPGAQIQPIEEGEAISLQDAIDQTDDEEFEFIKTGMPGVDYVLSGGIPRNISIMLCADPGAGKSTLLIELFRLLVKRKAKVLYANTEETIKQLARRYSRLGRFPSQLQIIHECDLGAIFQAAEKIGPDVMAIDSLQGLEGVCDPNGNEYSPGSAMSVTQAAREIKKFAGEQCTSVFAVGHVNKDGTISGSNTVKHMLDGTLYLHSGTNEQDPHRVLECQGKYRFGEKGRRAVFKMDSTGLHDLNRGVKTAFQGNEGEEIDLAPQDKPNKPRPLTPIDGGKSRRRLDA